MEGDLLPGLRLESHGAGVGIAGALELQAVGELEAVLGAAAVLADRDRGGVRGADGEVPCGDVLGVVTELELSGVEGAVGARERLRGEPRQQEGDGCRGGDRQAQSGEDARGAEHGSPHRDAGWARRTDVDAGAGTAQVVAGAFPGNAGSCATGRSRDRSPSAFCALHRAVTGVATMRAGNRSPRCEQAWDGRGWVSTDPRVVSGFASPWTARKCSSSGRAAVAISCTIWAPGRFSPGVSGAPPGPEGSAQQGTVCTVSRTDTRVFAPSRIPDEQWRDGPCEMVLARWCGQ